MVKDSRVIVTWQNAGVPPLLVSPLQVLEDVLSNKYWYNIFPQLFSFPLVKIMFYSKISRKINILIADPRANSFEARV